MEISTSLVHLAEMHPELEWDEIAAAAVSVLEDSGLESPFRFPLVLTDLPGFGSAELTLAIDRTGVPASRVARVRRTYELSRRVELMAIAIAGLGLYHGGRHEIRDVAARGSGADYLVDEARHLLEVAGRSRRSDGESAWRQRQERLAARSGHGFYVCVVELESPAGRLAFRP